jgi:hypothetical protein
VPTITDQAIHDYLVTLITLAAVAYLLVLLVRRLTRARPGLSLGRPVAAAFSFRILAAAAVSQLSFANTLRGGDELTFQMRADEVEVSAFGSEAWTDALTGQLHVFILALQSWALDSPQLALRTTEAGIAVAGLVLLAVAVYELAGPRAALIAAWVLAVEPTNVFFSTLLHKEPLMMLASGLVAYGGAMMWKRADLRYLMPIVLGCLVAVATRPYAGWFLIAAGAAITLHAGLRTRHETSVRALVLVAIVVLFGAIAAPTVLEASTEEKLEELQASQSANAANTEANLSLEEVDFSTREAIITNLPSRIPDVILRPFPWQLNTPSQQFGLAGTLVAYTTLVLLIAAVVSNFGRVMDRAGPLIYIAFFLLMAYSLSAGNAGTAFRYRTHIVAVALCMLVVLRFARERVKAPGPERRRVAPYAPPGAEPV